MKKGLVIEKKICKKMLTQRVAVDERIAAEPHRTTADRIVIDDLADSSDSATSKTGINTLLITASSILKTIGANDALGSTGRRTTHVSPDTRADSLAIFRATLAVRTTG